MNRQVYRYQFAAEVNREGLEVILCQAILAVEALHGAAEARLSARHFLDLDRLVCVIDASSSAGHDLSRVFAGLCLSQLGDDAFDVRRVDRSVPNGVS